MTDDDKNWSLHQLNRQHTSITSQLVDIGSERNQQKHVKFESFVSNLHCLEPKGLKLRRRSIDAFYDQRFVALSYTWTPSTYEDHDTGRYDVANWDDEYFDSSRVRNCVLDRVLHYMGHIGVRLLWIDAHCIRQVTCGADDCGHLHCINKRNAIQAMDLVYQLSEHPLALLGWPLRTGSELYLLKLVVSGDLVDDDCVLRYTADTEFTLAKKALLLLSEITRDLWWRRAWTFQENYRGGTQMQLLIRHESHLEQEKQRHKVFGEIPGELCLSSVNFSTQATRLCLALHKVAGLSTQDAQRIKSVLRAAGRYTLILHSSSSMTPTVIADIESRELMKPWDRLAIIANCCQYPVRLDSGGLSRQSHSPSLSVLAMCLLNGEILNNCNDDVESVGELTMSECLNRLTFQTFNAPEDETRPLTFNKGCRLTGVELMASGIKTRGHLWKLGRIIDTSKFRRSLPRIKDPRGRLNLVERQCLLQLVFCLDDLGYPLAGWIRDYLSGDADADAEADYASFTEMYLHRMAAELAAAILAGRKLRLGCIWSKSNQPMSYSGIFVWSGEGGDRQYSQPSELVFTSVRKSDPESQTYDIDHHVSLLVDEETISGCSLPQLRVRSWLLGMYFFDGCPRIEVVFPWPRALEFMKPESKEVG